ncbi:Cytochrome P450 [Mycena sanguinolenta]|uniref:Cytochrome P450 n=1 Tax=Mycena sanguinolenta TaxID=230812 RepID=A0A8H6XZH1_9AGAR|nr:Cytochrome P450 [Mycena sanguinolenta]
MISILLIIVCVGCFIHLLSIGRREPGLPPGPPTVPLLGNLHLLPDIGQNHLKLMEWSRKYGEIFSVKIGPRTTVVLSSPTAIKEVVDKTSWAASSRPPNYLGELAAGGYHILMAADTRLLRNLRKTLARFFSSANALHRVPIQAAESTQLLHELMTRPENKWFFKSVRRYTHSIAMINIYGHRISSVDSPKLQGFYDMLHRLVHILVPGAYAPVDLVPALKYLPEQWALWPAVCRRSESEMTAFHLEHCRLAEAHSTTHDGTEDESFISSISKMGLSREEYDAFSCTGLVMVQGGSDTSAVPLLSLILILAVYPEHQERAWREIEAVVGTARLPELADFSHMPFVDALIKEVARIRPTFPTGIPHFTTEEIRYKNYVVPKDTTVILNTYSIFHDPDIFEEPEVFNPDRFLQSEYGTRPGMDTDFRDNFSFGGGRRLCPGLHVARATMQLATMRLIWACSFSSAVDPKTEQPIGRDLDFYDSASCQQLSYCSTDDSCRNSWSRLILLSAGFSRGVSSSERSSCRHSRTPSPCCSVTSINAHLLYPWNVHGEPLSPLH